MTTTFAERLKHAMNEAHMSQSELSSKTGIPTVNARWAMR